MPKSLETQPGRTVAPAQTRPGPSHHPVLALQRSIGNQAVRRLLARDRDDGAMLVKVAKDLGAAALVTDIAAAGVEKDDIGYARRLKAGENDGAKPGLNVAGDIGSRGRTGFVSADGTYLGDILPAATGDLPRVAICIGKQAFDEGENAVRGTLRHELEHAMHAQLLLAVQRRWRDSLAKAGTSVPTSEDEARKQLYAFAAGPKASPSQGKLAGFELDLIHGDTEGTLASTELLAHLAGFVTVFETTPAADAAAFSSASMPPAIEQLRGAAQKGYPQATDRVRAVARDRLATYYRSLAPDKQTLVHDWLTFLRTRAGASAPKDAATPETRATAIVRAAFGGHVDFLDWVLASIPKSR